MVGVVGSSPIVPTKFGRKKGRLGGPFFWVLVSKPGFLQAFTCG